MKLHLRHSALEFAKRLRRSFSARGLILMYHRVNTIAPDPWSLCVSPTNFAEQLQVLKRTYRVIPLQEFVGLLQAKKLPPRAIAITFDDGYADNYVHALPLLEAAELPATFFVSTGHLASGQVEAGREFWWDELGKYVLESNTLPTSLELEVRGTRRHWHLGNMESGILVDNDPLWLAPRHQGEPRSRLGFYQELWHQLYPLTHDVRLALLGEIAAWSGHDLAAREAYRLMTEAELLHFAQSPLVELGGHTVRHPALSAHSVDVQREEILQNKRTLETLLNRPIRLFSYPHGDYRAETVQLLRQAGFACGCTTDAQPVWRGSDPFQLPRHWVGNWDGQTFAAHLQSWLR